MSEQKKFLIEYAETISRSQGQLMGEMIDAFLAIVEALKSQPGFDRERFNELIRRCLDNAPPDEGIARRILEASIEE